MIYYIYLDYSQGIEFLYFAANPTITKFLSDLEFTVSSIKCSHYLPFTLKPPSTHFSLCQQFKDLTLECHIHVDGDKDTPRRDSVSPNPLESKICVVCSSIISSSYIFKICLQSIPVYLTPGDGTRRAYSRAGSRSCSSSRHTSPHRWPALPPSPRSISREDPAKRLVSPEAATDPDRMAMPPPQSPISTL